MWFIRPETAARSRQIPTVIRHCIAAPGFVTRRLQDFSRVVILAFMLAFTIGLPRSSLATGIGIQPANIEMAATPGSTIRQTIRVGNLRTDRSQQFIVGLADWSLNAGGQLRLLPPSSNSAASWTRFSPARFTLKPAEAQNVIIEIAVPPRIDAKEYRVAILVTNPLPSAEEMKKLNGVWNQTQVASLLYLVPQGIAPIISVSDAEWLSQDEKGTVFRALVKNTGTAHARLIAVTEFIDATGNSLYSVDSQAVFLEGQSREWRAVISAEQLPPAQYSVRWKLYNVFDPKRPNERAGELIQEQMWKWVKTTPAAKPVSETAKPAKPAKPAEASAPSTTPLPTPPPTSPPTPPLAPPSAPSPTLTSMPTLPTLEEQSALSLLAPRSPPPLSLN